jgi:hypothetical protein
MKISFDKLFTSTSATPNEALPLSEDELLGGLVVLYAPKTNTEDIVVGPDEDADFYDLEPGQYYALPGTHLPQMAVDLGAWHMKSAAASQALRIVYVPISS